MVTEYLDLIQHYGDDISAFYAFGKKHGVIQLKLIRQECDGVQLPYGIVKLMKPAPINTNTGTLIALEKNEVPGIDVAVIVVITLIEEKKKLKYQDFIIKQLLNSSNSYILNNLQILSGHTTHAQVIQKPLRIYSTSGYKLQKGIPSEAKRRRISKTASKKIWAIRYTYDCIKILSFYEKSQPVPFFKISKNLPAYEHNIFTDASADFTNNNNKILLNHGFGAIFGNFAIVESWSELHSIVEMLGHFDEKEFKWSSTKVEHIAAIFSLFTFVHNNLIPPRTKIFNVLDNIVGDLLLFPATQCLYGAVLTWIYSAPRT